MTSVWEGRRRRIQIQEVGTRDGLQSESAFVPSAEKIALVNVLSQTGVSRIEVTAFVSALAIPALKDAEIVMNEITRQPGVIYTALVPNLMGAQRAIAARTDELNMVMSATQTHNLSNLRMTQEQSFSSLVSVAALSKDAGIGLNVSLSCCFGCPMDGEVELGTVMQWCRRFMDTPGVTGISLCDTTGMAYPSQVHEWVKSFLASWPASVLTLHFHNTRGMGLANILAAIDAGAFRFDASLGGIGGCPYAPGASGNVCTEEVVHSLELMGYDTHVDLDVLMGAAQRLPALIGHEVPSQLVKAGRRLDLHPHPEGLKEIKDRALSRQAAK
jgi:hydroxymethylglutaryl-CoA lyase